jgi:type 1 glutamine amidotransferase
MKKLLLAVIVTATLQASAAEKKIVLVAGNPSHGPGDHEHRAGCLLLKSCLDKVPGIAAHVYSNGWPGKVVDGRKVDDNAVFDGASAIVMYADGGPGHPAIKPERLQFLEGLRQKGVGLGCLHYAVEVPKDKGGPEFLRWIGGYFETYWSVNPHWDANFTNFPAHPIARGVQPFKIRDEWYYHMRFPDGMKGVTPILTAIPPDATRGREGVTNAHGGNPFVFARKGQPEHVMWAVERPDGGRGFGFTGAHFHKNWGHDEFRKVVLNAILWIAKAEVPAGGVPSQLEPGQLEQNLDPKGQPRPRPAAAAPPKPGAGAAQ